MKPEQRAEPTPSTDTPRPASEPVPLLDYASRRPISRPAVPRQSLTAAAIGGAVFGLVMAWLSVVGGFHGNNTVLWAMAGGPAALIAVGVGSPLMYLAVMAIATPTQYACYAWLLARSRWSRNTVISIAAAHAAVAVVLLLMTAVR